MKTLASIKIKHVPLYFRILDYLMVPIMWVILGFKLQRTQETHKWHMQNIDCDVIDNSMSLFIKGTDNTRTGRRVPQKLYGAYMHITVASGWKDYAVLETKDFSRYWHIGWRIVGDDKRPPKCQTQKLRIHTPLIKVLIGGEKTSVYFFGINERDKQIPLQLVAKGKIGDGKFRNVRLF